MIGTLSVHVYVVQSLVTFALPAQVIVCEILSAWGPAGFDRHICSMQSEYAHRAAVIQSAAEQHLTGLADWTRPAAGMFLWLKLLTVSDADEILDKLKDAGVVVVPGT